MQRLFGSDTDLKPRLPRFVPACTIDTRSITEPHEPLKSSKMSEEAGIYGHETKVLQAGKSVRVCEVGASVIAACIGIKLWLVHHVKYVEKTEKLRRGTFSTAE